jgi:predicted TIM-barrel fold metal-dependent hydrolase
MSVSWIMGGGSIRVGSRLIETNSELATGTASAKVKRKPIAGIHYSRRPTARPAMCFIRFAALCLALLFAVPALAAEPNACVPAPVIDVHAHFYSEDRFWGPAPNPVTGEIESKTAAEHAAQTLAEMEKNQVVLALAGAPLGWELPDNDRLVPSLEAFRAEDANLEELKTAVEEKRIRALGELAPIYEGISPNDPRWDPVYAVAEEHGLPVGIHTGGGPPGIVQSSRPKFRYEYGNPFQLQDVLVKHPDMKVYMMHAGMATWGRETLAMMHMYPDLYVDIAVANWVEPFMQRALKDFLVEAMARGYGDRILYGSDQMVWPSAIKMSIDHIKSADYLTEQQKRDILFENAVRFLELSEEEREKLLDRACP